MSTLNGTAARRYAVYGRAAGITILVCAGALWAVPLPGMKQLPAKPVPVAPPPVADAAPAAASAGKIDADMVDATSTRLDMAVVHAEQPKAPVETASKPIDPPLSGPEWTYLGPIHEADRSLAIIAVDGHQKVLAEGRTFGDTKLITVEDTGIAVEVNGIPKRIDRGHRNGSTVAWVRNLQNNTPAARTVTGGPGQPGGAQPNLPPEVRQRLAERGITPDQMQNWRNGRGGGPGGAGGPGGGTGGGGGPGGRNRAVPGGGGGGGQRDGSTQPTTSPNTKPGMDQAVPIKDRSTLN